MPPLLKHQQKYIERLFPVPVRIKNTGLPIVVFLVLICNRRVKGRCAKLAARQQPLSANVDARRFALSSAA
jgi:hypothetical protein